MRWPKTSQSRPFDPWCLTVAWIWYENDPDGAHRRIDERRVGAGVPSIFD